MKLNRYKNKSLVLLPTGKTVKNTLNITTTTIGTDRKLQDFTALNVINKSVFVPSQVLLPSGIRAELLVGKYPV